MRKARCSPGKPSGTEYGLITNANSSQNLTERLILAKIRLKAYSRRFVEVDIQLALQTLLQIILNVDAIAAIHYWIAFSLTVWRLTQFFEG